MEYVPGIKINRIKQLDKLGVDRKRYVFILYTSKPWPQFMPQLTFSGSG